MHTVWDKFWNSRSSAEDFYPQHGRLERAITDVGEWKGKWGMEVGCGLGGSAQFMRKAGMRMILLDYAEGSLKKCRERLGKGEDLWLVRGDVFHLPFKDGSVDLVFHQGLIEHFRDDEPRQIIAENLRVIKTGGWLGVDVPQTFHIQSFCARPFIWTGTWFAGWQTFYSIWKLKKLIVPFQMENVRYYGSLLNPSFFYRALRWVLKSKILLPLNPPTIPFVARWRQKIRHHLFYHWSMRWMGSDIGVVGRKGRD